MVKSTVEKLSPTRVKIDVEVPFDELKPHIQATYKQLANQIQVPGFRKGKVPAAIIDQRVGREYVIESAVNEGMNDFYRQALTEAEVSPLSQPELEVSQIPAKDGEEDLKFSFELDVRPEIELPDYKGLEVEVEAKEADEEAVQAALDELRNRYGTLKTVERPAAEDDFVTIDLTATVDGEEVDSAADLSYQVGAGTMLEGIDEALTGLSADEDAIFETKLAGGEHSGKDASVKVVLKAVKERELPEADDEFAQLASEFDTIDELKADLAKKVEEDLVGAQGAEAQEKVLEKLQEIVEVPVPEAVIAEQVEQHFSQGHDHGDGEEHDTEEHRKEVEEGTRNAFKAEIILDEIANAEELTVDQGELIEYVIATAGQYGMDPNQFAQMLDGAGQIPVIMGEVRRRKALAKVLEFATVKDSKGNEIDLSSFLTPAEDLESADSPESADSGDSADSPESADSAESAK